MAKNIGILMTRGVDGDDGPAVIARARAARERGDRVHVFGMIDGVQWVTDPAFVALADRGVKLSVCSLNAEERGIPAVDGVDFASQYVLARIVAECDEFLAFT